MSYDKNKNVIQESCKFEECTNSKTENQIIEYPLLLEEIEKIIEERYSDKDEKTKIFIRKALIKHGNKYDYSNVVYIKSFEKVEIICRVENHETFWQTPNQHLIGCGCPICGGRQKLTLEKFIKRAKEIHDNKYDYSKSKYINAHSKIEIVCPIENHGSFFSITILSFEWSRLSKM